MFCIYFESRDLHFYWYPVNLCISYINILTIKSHFFMMVRFTFTNLSTKQKKYTYTCTYKQTWTSIPEQIQLFFSFCIFLYLKLYKLYNFFYSAVNLFENSLIQSKHNGYGWNSKIRKFSGKLPTRSKICK